MQYHFNAKTNIAQRQAIKQSRESVRDLSKVYRVSHVTVAKWKLVEHLEDRSSRPKTIHYALSRTEVRIIKKVRKKGLFSLDDLYLSLAPYLAKLNRTNCYRVLKRCKLNKLTDKERNSKKKFANYLPGFLHIDCFYLPKIAKKRYYCFLAIDRTTKLVFLEIYPRKRQYEAADFLMKVLEFFPYRIHRILTDNGREFSLERMRNRFGQIKTESLFDLICEWLEIKHKTTKVKHPWTNGQAERMVQTVKKHTIKIHHYQDVEGAIRDIKRFQDTHNYYRRLKSLQGKTPYQATYEWFVKKPEIFLRDLTTDQKVIKEPTSLNVNQFMLTTL